MYGDLRVLTGHVAARTQAFIPLATLEMSDKVCGKSSVCGCAALVLFRFLCWLECTWDFWNPAATLNDEKIFLFYKDFIY